MEYEAKGGPIEYDRRRKAFSIENPMCRLILGFVLIIAGIVSFIRNYQTNLNAAITSGLVLVIIGAVILFVVIFEDRKRAKARKEH